MVILRSHIKSIDWSSLGVNVANAINSNFGTWRFILTMSGLLVAWFTFNAIPSLPHFDPYPFFFVNLTMSAMASYTGPLLKMVADRAEGLARAHNDMQMMALVALNNTLDQHVGTTAKDNAEEMAVQTELLKDIRTMLVMMTTNAERQRAA